MNLLITGATGFIGIPLTTFLRKNDGVNLKIIVRNNGHNYYVNNKNVFKISGFESDFNLRHILVGVDTVIHLAGRAHIIKDNSKKCIDIYRNVNVTGAINLARQAVDSNVKRFIYISTAKVNGERSLPSKPFTELDNPYPETAYSISKYEAEEGLKLIGYETGLEIVIIRPPLVYGPNVRANFYSLMNLIYKKIPLPFGCLKNSRSFLNIDNLIDLIVRCIDHPGAANQTFLASDDEDVSTTELLKKIGYHLKVNTVLYPTPEVLLRVGGTLLFKSDIVSKLCDSMQVDIAKAKSVLSWDPPVSLDDGLRKVAEGYIDEKKC